jgi:5-dehydro-2-deoxygluconokinase
MAAPTLDLITIGRCSLDLYGQQIGGRLEDMGSFSKAIGGCPANIAVGTARLGLRSALLTRVGDEQVGRFILEQLAREGVETAGVVTDPQRLTALVMLGVRDSHTFPLIFYRDNCADMALCEDDVNEGFIASAAAIVVTGTHFAKEGTAAAQHKAIRIAKANGRKVIFDVDYRPNLWGLAGHDAGESRYIRSDTVTAHLAPVLTQCDLIVGTEEELHVAGGSEDTLEAIRNIRAKSAAVIVCKRGPMGCVVFPDAIPESLDDGVRGPGFPVEVYNVLGAGDSFMSGFLRGWLRDEPLETCCAYANACGAFAVSRLLCSPEIPTFPELQYFLSHGSPHRALRHDRDINHIHWATTRPASPPGIMALAIDHRVQLEAVAREVGAPFERLQDFKVLAVQAAARVELTGSRPLDFEYGGSLGTHLLEWPTAQVIKCLCFYHPDDPEELRLRQERELARVYDACRTLGRDLLIEIIAGKHGVLQDDTIPRVVQRIYDIGIKPDWWKLEPQKSATAWSAISEAVQRNDSYCRGVMVLGLEAPFDDLVESFRACAGVPVVKGFAVGRTIHIDPARAWLSGRISDAEAVDQMAERFARLVAAWTDARRAKAA